MDIVTIPISKGLIHIFRNKRTTIRTTILSSSNSEANDSELLEKHKIYFLVTDFARL